MTRWFFIAKYSQDVKRFEVKRRLGAASPGWHQGGSTAPRAGIGGLLNGDGRSLFPRWAGLGGGSCAVCGWFSSACVAVDAKWRSHNESRAVRERAQRGVRSCSAHMTDWGSGTPYSSSFCSPEAALLLILRRIWQRGPSWALFESLCQIVRVCSCQIRPDCQPSSHFAIILSQNFWIFHPGYPRSLSCAYSHFCREIYSHQMEYHLSLTRKNVVWF